MKQCYRKRRIAWKMAADEVGWSLFRAEKKAKTMVAEE